MKRLTLAINTILMCFGTAHAADPFLGHEVYQRHCQRCHGEDGRGQDGATPDFRRGQGLYRSDPELLNTLRNGLGIMPAYQGMLSDDELLNAIAFLRTMP